MSSSLPHGWGHDVEGVQMAVARRHPGVNSNVLADDLLLDAPSGNAVRNGIPVRVEAVPRRTPRRAHVRRAHALAVRHRRVKPRGSNNARSSSTSCLKDGRASMASR